MSKTNRSKQVISGGNGLGLSMIGALVAALIIVALLYTFVPWKNQTASDSANSNAGSILGQGSGGASGPAPTMPGQAAPASGTAAH